MKHVLVAGTLALLAVSACATKRLPPGTPPPEYETRAFPPWPPASAPASAAVASSAEAPPVPTSEAAPSAGAAASAGKTPPSPSPSAAGE